LNSTTSKGNAKGVYVSYTDGFVHGLKEKLEEQCRTLALIIPPDVVKEYKEYSKDFVVHKSRKSRTKVFDEEAYVKGLYDGKYSLHRQELDI